MHSSPNAQSINTSPASPTGFTNQGESGGVQTVFFLLIDNAGHHLLIDGSGHKLIITA